jgi:hypothetical protein
MANGPVFTLGAQEAAFLRIEHLSIVAASRGQDNVPFVARALGRRLSTDRRQVTLFFSSADAREMLTHMAVNRVLAAVSPAPALIDRCN